MGNLVKVTDGLENYTANLGTGRDKASHSQFVPRIWNEAELQTAYVESWACGKIVDIPARDSVRAWRAWQAKKPQIDKLEAEEKRLDLQGKLEEALKLARLYGGSAIYIATNRPADHAKPISETEELRYIRVFSKAQLSAGPVDIDLESEYFGQPSYYSLSSQDRQINIHPSRLVRFYGRKIPDSGYGSMYCSGWGVSVLASCMTSVLRAESTMANANSLVYEAKVDVLGVPDLMQQMTDDPEFEGKMLRRMTLAAMGKGINGMLVRDSLETYDTKSASFGGLPELIEKFLQEIAGAADIPVTRLLGQSPSGLNSTGESDLRNYYDRIKADQSLSITPELSKLDEMIIRKSLGSRPREIHYNWNNLWQPTAKEHAEIGKIVADTIVALNGTALINTDALSAASINWLTELGIIPGLEGAVDEFGSDIDEQELDPANTDPTSNSTNDE